MATLHISNSAYGLNLRADVSALPHILRPLGVVAISSCQRGGTHSVLRECLWPMNACGRGIDRRSGTRDRLLDMAQFVWQLGCQSCESRRRKPLTASAMYDRGREVYGSCARMRAAGWTNRRPGSS